MRTCPATCSRCWPPAWCGTWASRSRSCVAEDPYAAEDAAELVDIDIDEEPAVLDAAPRPAPARRACSRPGNVAADFTLGFGDTETAFRQAAHVVETEVEIGRHTGVPLEPRVLLADARPGAPAGCRSSA